MYGSWNCINEFYKNLTSYNQRGSIFYNILRQDVVSKKVQ